MANAPMRRLTGAPQARWPRATCPAQAANERPLASGPTPLSPLAVLLVNADPSLIPQRQLMQIYHVLDTAYCRGVPS